MSKLRPVFWNVTGFAWWLVLIRLRYGIFHDALNFFLGLTATYFYTSSIDALKLTFFFGNSRPMRNPLSPIGCGSSLWHLFSSGRFVIKLFLQTHIFSPFRYGHVFLVCPWSILVFVQQHMSRFMNQLTLFWNNNVAACYDLTVHLCQQSFQALPRARVDLSSINLNIKFLSKFSNIHSLALLVCGYRYRQFLTLASQNFSRPGLIDFSCWRE